MADRKNFNGLRGSGNIPMLGQGQQLSREQQAQRAIAMEMQAISREIYIAAVAGFLRGTDLEGDCAMPSNEELQEFAATSQRAARAYFLGLGVISEEPPPQTDSPASPVT